jgi:hypothetical protein
MLSLSRMPCGGSLEALATLSNWKEPAVDFDHLGRLCYRTACEHRAGAFCSTQIGMMGLERQARTITPRVFGVELSGSQR